MTELALFVLFGFVGHNRDLFGLAVLYDLSCYGCARNIRRTDCDTVIISDCDNLIEGVFALCFGVSIIAYIRITIPYLRLAI